jgi:hypothetical protein
MAPDMAGDGGVSVPEMNEAAAAAAFWRSCCCCSLRFMEASLRRRVSSKPVFLSRAF